MPAKLPFIAIGEDERLELTVVDPGSHARSGKASRSVVSPRASVFRDERDLVEEADRASGAELNVGSWTLARLLASSPHALDRVKRAALRHARAASDEGATRASDPAVVVFRSRALARAMPTPVCRGARREGASRRR